MANIFARKARLQFRACTGAPSAAAYHMISAAEWLVLVVAPGRECLFALTIPADFPLKSPEIRPLSANFGPICTDGATSVLSAVEIAAGEIPPGATVDREVFAAELAAVAASRAEYAAGWAAPTN